MDLEIDRLKVDVGVIESEHGVGGTRVTHGLLLAVDLAESDDFEKRSVQGTPLGPRGFDGLDQEHGQTRNSRDSGGDSGLSAASTDPSPLTVRDTPSSATLLGP